jgi:hypothetical protein
MAQARWYARENIQRARTCTYKEHRLYACECTVGICAIRDDVKTWQYLTGFNDD